MNFGIKEENPEMFQLYCEFLQFYHENYPDNFIVLIGDQSNYGHKFGLELIKENNSIGSLCILKGGIDAL